LSSRPNPTAVTARPATAIHVRQRVHPATAELASARDPRPRRRPPRRRGRPARCGGRAEEARRPAGREDLVGVPSMNVVSSSRPLVSTNSSPRLAATHQASGVADRPCVCTCGVSPEFGCSQGANGKVRHFSRTFLPFAAVSDAPMSVPLVRWAHGAKRRPVHPVWTRAPALGSVRCRGLTRSPRGNGAAPTTLADVARGADVGSFRWRA
jgi:hypothetical protein